MTVSFALRLQILQFPTYSTAVTRVVALFGGVPIEKNGIFSFFLFHCSWLINAVAALNRFGTKRHGWFWALKYVPFQIEKKS